MTSSHLNKYPYTMIYIILAIVFMHLASCNSTQITRDRDGCDLPDGYKRILITSDEPYQFYQIRAKNGIITWNEFPINSNVLRIFASQLAMLPKDAGSAVLEVNRSVSCDDRLAVRTALTGSNLCEQGRCWEFEGVVKYPVVY